MIDIEKIIKMLTDAQIEQIHEPDKAFLHIEYAIRELYKLHEVKRGEWVRAIIRDRAVMLCSICHEEPYRKSDREMPNFCPNCGADMRGGE